MNLAAVFRVVAALHRACRRTRPADGLGDRTDRHAPHGLGVSAWS
jgi:hypothetical protein